MKAVIDTEWLDKQIQISGDIYIKEVYKNVKAQLSPIKEHIENAFNAGSNKGAYHMKRQLKTGELTFPDINDYLKQNGYE